MNSEKRNVRFPIKRKLFLLSIAVAIPFFILLVYLLGSMIQYTRTYDKIVNNMTVANDYNLNFKEEMDESLYKLVVGYVTFDNISEDESLKDPYMLINELREAFIDLKDITMEAESRVWLETLLRNIDTLEDRVDDIVENVSQGGSYDKNIKELDNNIYILTELIQDDIQYYIYYQTKSMEKVTDNLNQQAERFAVVCGILMIALILLAAGIAHLISSDISKPIEELYRATEKVAEGDFSVRAKVSSRDEVAVLADGFNNMAGSMQELLDRMKEEEQKMRRADLRLLQEQINPHFLYNTLETIIWLIEDGRTGEAVTMVVTLSNFFRLALSRGREFISIRDEENHIRSYLEIQRVRYRDILEYDIQIDKVLYDYQILKLTLQPLVENALYHGIKHKRTKGHISIYGEKEGGELRLVVRDDGAGMEEKELEQIRDEIQRPCEETEKGFGLANVNERIRVYFGTGYGMAIESEKNKGTVVEIRIPAVKTPEGRPER